MKNTNIEILNRKAHYNYDVIETYVAGIALYGYEVKSIRDGCANINDSYGIINNDEVILKNAHISVYKTAKVMSDGDPLCDKKLLLTKKEIKKINKAVEQPGYTIIPLKMFFNEKHYVKVLIGICKGKHDYDKREDIKKRDIERESQMKF